MNKIFLIIICRVIVFFIPAVLHAQAKDVSIRIVQDDSVLLSSYETNLVLQRKPFKILVMLENMDGVYCFASFADSIYRLTETDSIPGLSDISANAMAEEEFNKEKELLVSQDGWSYWFYDPALNWHRFDKKIVFLDSGRLVGSKSIEQVYFAPEKKGIKLKDINAPLYLFFVAVNDADSKDKPDTEIFRRKIKIEWTNRD